MTNVKQFKLPDVGEGLTEADIIKWHVQPGDPVEINQTIVEIETAKAIVELPCPYEGVVAELLVEEGQTIDVGVPIISVDVGGEATVATPVSEPPAQAAALKEDMVPSPAADPGTHIAPTTGPDEPAASAEPKRQPVLVGYGVKPGATKRRARKAPQATAESSPQPVDSTPAREAKALAKPPVRKMAKDLGVDLSTITGTGPEGSVTREDIQAAATQAPATAPPAGEAAREDLDGREERVPVKGVRKSTATAMVRSAFSAPHVTTFLQVDVTETMEAVRRLRALPDFTEVKVSPLLLVAKALLAAVRRHPEVNATWADEEIVVKHYVNLGIAAATPRGLLVPNIKDAHRMSLPELARALAALTETARAGKAQVKDLTGGTITITNVGVFGVDTGTPILTPGESAILAVGQIRDMPWVHEGELAVRKVSTLSLSFDHRIVDGELGSVVLREVGSMLEDPLRLLAWS